MPDLLLGPMLRHVDSRSATVWVETDGPCTVEVLGTSTPTWRVGGHHYALACVDGLPPGISTPYEVRLDGRRVWPDPDSPYPPSRIRTIDPDRPFRLVFGSCRAATPRSWTPASRFGADALDAYADRLARTPGQDWPDALLLVGDQVYADETSPVTQRRIKQRRDVSRPPHTQVADFEEYTYLYQETWSDPQLRWLLSTIPTSMIFDDHDVHDDWNTSHAWREEMAATPWWEERITGALMAYWIYQHLGNLAPDALAADELYKQVCAAEDAEPVLREFARWADRETDGAKGAQWSYRRDFGRCRLLVVDTRCGRILADQRRSMLSEPEFGWIESQVDGEYDHLLVGTSLPWLLPRAIHDLESADEAVCAGRRGRRLARLGERVRRGADMEHWASFRESFDRLAALLGRVASGQHGRPPATVCVLSGDVHHGYVARARYPGPDGPEPDRRDVYQLVCSPVHQGVPRSMRLGFTFGWSRPAELIGRLAARLARVAPPPLSWDKVAGPFFGNQLATVTLDDGSARVTFECAERVDDRTARMRQTAEVTLWPAGDERNPVSDGTQSRVS
jgi:PhoD-like phosphatase